MKTKVFNSIIVIALAVSIGCNIFFFAWKPLRRRVYLQGTNDTINAFIAQVQQNKQVVINTPNGPIILILKESAK